MEENNVKLKDGELKIFYQGDLNVELDKALESVLKKFGYERWASGMSMNWVRDLAFDKKVENG